MQKIEKPIFGILSGFDERRKKKEYFPDMKTKPFNSF